MDTVATKLKAIAAELREHPERWCHGWWARDANGIAVDCGDASAVSWCARGHVYRCSDWLDLGEVLERAAPAPDDPSKNPVAAFNDTPGRTAAEVADLFDRAADLASQTAGAAS